MHLETLEGDHYQIDGMVKTSPVEGVDDARGLALYKRGRCVHTPLEFSMTREVLPSMTDRS
jgi:hypothetical protein